MLALLALIALLAACGQTTSPATNGADAGLKAITTPTLARGTPTATTIPLPYTFPKQWLAAPDGGDLPAAIGSLAFAPSAPQAGYVCGVSSTSADNAATTPPYVVATSDGGQSWHTVSGSAAHAKSACALFVDQNNGRDVFAEAGDLLRGRPQLYRSQDGGATWKLIPQPSISGANTAVVTIAVVQSRLLAVIGVMGEGSLPHTLFASDNNGQSWSPIDLSMNGQALQISEQLWFDGPALVVEAGLPCQSPCGYTLPVSSGHLARRPLNQPLSSQPPTPNYYFKSSDGGRTWTSFATPVSNLGNLAFARSSDGATTYALGTALAVPNQPAATSVAFYSTDGGAHWRRLPTLAGVENGYLDPSALGLNGAYVFPDGSVAAMAFHSSGPNDMNDAGAFLLRPGDASPTWTPLIRETDGSFWQAIPTATGIRVWLVRFPPTPQDATTFPGGHLVYFDLP
jgi:photosystem II stability/assembly factor-like uncharacterized protein